MTNLISAEMRSGGGFEPSLAHRMKALQSRLLRKGRREASFVVWWGSGRVVSRAELPTSAGNVPVQAAEGPIPVR